MRAARRDREGPRFRHRQIHDDSRRGSACADRHDRLHEPRAGERGTGRQPLRHLVAGDRDSRDAHRRRGRSTATTARAVLQRDPDAGSATDGDVVSRRARRHRAACCGGRSPKPRSAAILDGAPGGRAVGAGVGDGPARRSSRAGELDAPRAMSATERRRAAVLVTVVSDYAALVDQHHAGRGASADRPAARHAQSTSSASYGGLVNQAIGEEIVSLFGVPIAHDDDDLRAVRAALELHARVRALEAERRARASVARPVGSARRAGRRTTSARRARAATTSSARRGRRGASRLAALADADELLISPETQRLVGPYMHTAAVPAGRARVAGRAGDAVSRARRDRDCDAAGSVEPNGADALRRPPVRAVDAASRTSPAPRAAWEP